MVAKLSSVRIITAASFETSVPVIPIATPMSAALSAGASLTPSPVIDDDVARALEQLDQPDLVLGRDPRDDADVRTARPSSSSSLIAANSVPVIARPSMPSSPAMAAAVVAWSPVIIRTWMPAEWHSAIAAFASGRGGSTIPTMASSVRSVTSGSRSPSGRNVAGSKSRWATTITRWPELAIRSFASRARCRFSSVTGTSAPSGDR